MIHEVPTIKDLGYEDVKEVSGCNISLDHVFYDGVVIREAIYIFRMLCLLSKAANQKH